MTYAVQSFNVQQQPAYAAAGYTVQPQTYQSGFTVAPTAYTSPAQAFSAYSQPLVNWTNRNIVQPMQQFQQKHPYMSAAAGAGMGAVAGMSAGCAYAGMSVAAPFMGQAMQQAGQAINNWITR